MLGQFIKPAIVEVQGINFNNQITEYQSKKTLNITNTTGFFINKEGVIITNEPISKSSSKVTIQMYNGCQFKAEVIGADEYFGIAVLKPQELIPSSFCSKEGKDKYLESFPYLDIAKKEDANILQGEKKVTSINNYASFQNVLFIENITLTNAENTAN